MDAAHTRGRHDDRLGTLGLEKTPHIGLRGKIEFGVRPEHQPGMPPLLQRPDDGRPHQPTVAGDEYPRGRG